MRILSAWNFRFCLSLSINPQNYSGVCVRYLSFKLGNIFAGFMEGQTHNPKRARTPKLFHKRRKNCMLRLETSKQTQKYFHTPYTTSIFLLSFNFFTFIATYSRNSRNRKQPFYVFGFSSNYRVCRKFSFRCVVSMTSVFAIR